MSEAAMAGMFSCCQQTSTTPSMALTAVARACSSPMSKRVSTVIPSFAACGETVSSGRRLLLPSSPLSLAGVEAKIVGGGNVGGCPSEGWKNSAQAPVRCQPRGVSDRGSASPISFTAVSGSLWGFSAWRIIIRHCVAVVQFTEP